MNKLICSAILALVLTACQNSGNDGSRTTTPPVSPTISAPATPVATADSGNQQKAAGTPATNAAPANAKATALNPAHGQPGHRCDIPEGAPLNSAPISTTIPATATASPVVSQPAPAPAAAKGVKLNPPHGQPGHDCSVAVGQPLKS